MMASFVKDFLLPSLGLSAVIAIVVGCAAWLGYVINSIARSADALERIADALEDGKDVEDDDIEKEGGAHANR